MDVKDVHPTDWLLSALRHLIAHHARVLSDPVAVELWGETHRRAFVLAVTNLVAAYDCGRLHEFSLGDVYERAFEQVRREDDDAEACERSADMRA